MSDILTEMERAQKDADKARQEQEKKEGKLAELRRRFWNVVGSPPLLGGFRFPSSSGMTPLVLAGGGLAVLMLLLLGNPLVLGAAALIAVAYLMYRREVARR